MTLDIAMGGSTNTVLHLLAAAHEGEVDFTHGRHRPAVAARAGAVQGRARRRRRPHGGRAPRRRHHGHPRRARPRRPASTPARRPCTAATLGEALDRWDIIAHRQREPCAASTARRPGGVPTQTAFSQSRRYDELDLDRADRRASATPSTPISKDGGLAVLYGNLAAGRLHREDGGRRRQRSSTFTGPGAGLREPGRGGGRHPRRQGQGRRRRGDPLRRPARRPRHAGDALSDELPEIEGPRQGLRADHRRPLLGRHVRPVDRPRLARSGRGRADRPGRGRRPHRDRHPEPPHPSRGDRRRARRAPRRDGSQGRGRPGSPPPARAQGHHGAAAPTRRSPPAPPRARCGWCRTEESPPGFGPQGPKP